MFSTVVVRTTSSPTLAGDGSISSGATAKVGGRTARASTEAPPSVNVTGPRPVSAGNDRVSSRASPPPRGKAKASCSRPSTAQAPVKVPPKSPRLTTSSLISG